jgi:hypothetical protein
MKKTLCPITKDIMECKDCKLPDDAFCPYIEFDKLIEKTLKLIRGVVEKNIS